MTPSLRRSAVLLAALVTWQAAAASHPESDPFPVLQGPYLGQEPPGTTPEIFAPGIVSWVSTEIIATLHPASGQKESP